MPTTNDRLLLIKNGRLLDPATQTDAHHDVLLHGPRVVRIGPDLTSGDAEIFDATGLIVAPGFIDLHCHLREPGQEMSETIETGTRSAARGGFTAVCCMPNTQPVNDNASVTRSIVERAAAAGSVQV
jgi:dihydroorotase